MYTDGDAQLQRMSAGGSGLGPCLTCDKPRPKSELVAALGKVATAGFSPLDTFEHRAHCPLQDVPQLTKSDQL